MLGGWRGEASEPSCPLYPLPGDLGGHGGSGAMASSAQKGQPHKEMQPPPLCRANQPLPRLAGRVPHWGGGT